MNKLKFLLVAGTGILLGSCTISHTAVLTNNPVGTKSHTEKTGFMKKDVDITYSGVMKKGNITKAGIAEMKTKMFIFPKVIITVTGE